MIAAEPSTRIGAVLKQKYRIERVLGEGGMGRVLAASHLVLGQLVALKILRPELRERPGVTERFLREARAASRIESPHVARVLDVDTLDDGTPFMVIEHLEGHDLGRVRDRNEPLLVHQAVGYVIEACEAIAEAHSLGIVHRDLKPPNLFLAKRRDGSTTIKVLDFGISKVQGGDSVSTALTQEKTGMGSPEYMSPEQTQSAKEVDARADIWSIGVILYELVSARGPFQGDGYADVCAKVLLDEPPPLRSIAPAVPEELDAIIRRCLQKDRKKRFGSVTELMAALRPFAAPLPRMTTGPMAPVRPATPSQPALERTELAGPAQAAAIVSAAIVTQPLAPPAITAQPIGAQHAAPSPIASPAPLSVPGIEAPPSQVKLIAVIAAVFGVVVIGVVIVAFSIGRSHVDAPSSASAAPIASVAPVGRFEVGDGEVRDLKTRRSWERASPPIEMSFSKASSHCGTMRGEGFPYRVPELDELRTLAEGIKQNRKADLFSESSLGYHWSSTPVPGKDKQLWIVRLRDGDVTSATPSQVARVRCVR